ncbi:hypothetical protein L842_3404 [Mycobacterium intracellulare MIN_052511_1280]|nr:hypothetical protein L842_3404 [Mycobacterium intracellulare MIN_052511_1280]
MDGLFLTPDAVLLAKRCGAAHHGATHFRHRRRPMQQAGNTIPAAEEAR